MLLVGVRHRGDHGGPSTRMREVVARVGWAVRRPPCTPKSKEVTRETGRDCREFQLTVHKPRTRR